MNFKDVHSVYFIGIGGIGMSGLARYFHAIGLPVAGYDKTRTTLCESLETEGIAITYQDGMAQVDETFQDVKHTLVVYTPAVPANHEQLTYFKSQGFQVKKRAEVLGLITKNNTSLAIAGTHGKTTTSSILAHLLKHSGLDINAFLGGLALNYNSNVLLGDENIAVVEADEFDRSFLQLQPNLALITNTDADHLDIYGDAANFKKGFEDFAKLCTTEGKLVIQKDVELNADYSYGLDDSCDFYAFNISVANGVYHFDLQLLDETAIGLDLALPGRHNVENAVGAAALAYLQGLSVTAIMAGLNSFEGVYRRFQYLIRDEHKVMIDDYAHHPSEIRATLNSAKELFKGKHITVVFQPHLFTRTRDFMEDFATSLSIADRVILLPIYPARELPIEGVDSSVLLEMVTSQDKALVAYDDLEQYMVNQKVEVLLMLGAGDIDRLVKPVCELLKASKL